MYYKIGEFANMMGVTADTLRLYERLGIIKSVKDEKNNYRYFHDLDARKLLWSRWYRSIEIPLSDVANLVNNADRYTAIEQLERRAVELEDEILKKQRLLKKINQIRENCINIDSSLGKCTIQRIPAFYRLKQTIVNTLLPNETMNNTVINWMNMLPFTFFSVKIPESALHDNSPNFEYDWGIAITQRDAEDFDLYIDDNVEYYPEKHCVSSVIRKSEKELITIDTIQHMIDFIGHEGYSINGDCMGHIIIPEKSKDDKVNYLHFQIPVK